MSGTRNLAAYLPASPIVVDAPNGEVRVEWRHFFNQLWARTGGPVGTPPTAAGVLSWNGRTGAVTLQVGDVTPLVDSIYVNVAGDTMTGPLVLSGAPVNPTDAADKAYVDAQIADLSDVYMRWVPYTGPPQSFLKQDLTRDGDWTMVANKDTTSRPAPQPSGTEEDLLPPWVPVVNSARATYTVYNEWTLSTAGWIDQYGGDVLTQNLNATHTITLQVGGVVKDTFTSAPVNSGLYLHNITPLLVTAGAVLRVTVKVTQVSNDLMYWEQQAGLFATPPTYCLGAVGSKDGAAAGTTAYGCHLQFIPGVASPDWDVVAYGGAAAGGGGLEDAPLDGQTYGRQSGAWAAVVPMVGATLTNAANDAAAATAGVPLNGIYRNGSVLMVRVT
jgi:hypothetical protein